MIFLSQVNHFYCIDRYFFYFQFDNDHWYYVSDCIYVFLLKCTLYSLLDLLVTHNGLFPIKVYNSQNCERGSSLEAIYWTNNLNEVVFIYLKIDKVDPINTSNLWFYVNGPNFEMFRTIGKSLKILLQYTSVHIFYLILYSIICFYTWMFFLWCPPNNFGNVKVVFKICEILCTSFQFIQNKYSLNQER